MKISLLQMDIAWHRVQENMAQAEMLMNQTPGANLYVLPEMWCTGFDVSPNEEALKQCAEGFEWMKRQARERQTSVAGSLIFSADEAYDVCTEKAQPSAGCANAFFLVDADGRVQRYDKRHLFGYGGEDLHYLAGKKRVTMKAGEVTILPQVCYDLRFPVASRNHAQNPYDLIVYVASWPASRQNAWDTLLRARAIENQCYVAGVNRVGNDLKCHYEGGTALIDPYGNAVFSLGKDAGAKAAELDLPRLAHFRNKFPVLNDADAFSLK